MAPTFSLSAYRHRVEALAHATYLVGRQVEAIVQSGASQQSADFRAVLKPTVLLSVGQHSTSHSLRQDIETFRRHDDVFSDDFLTDTVLIQGVQGWDVKNSQINWGGLRIQTVDGPWNPTDVITIQGDLPPGPYFLTAENKIAQAWRLYPDIQDAFSTTCVPSEDYPDRFEPLELTSLKGLWRQVAVPSRLYSTPTERTPLAGKRISIKDNFKIAGVQTTQNNRAWVSLYSVEDETAKYVQQLISLGAIIVGKTKMCSFESSEEATDHTTGGGASLASYDWLDYSIGTDTTGSIRMPAAWNGLFGMRVSTGTDKLEGVYPACRFMDTLGLLSRSIDGLQSLMKSSLPSLGTPSEANFPKRLLYCTDFLPHTNAAQQSLIEEFVQLVENYLDVKRIDFSVVDRWSRCPPPEAEGKDLKTYINKTAYYPFYYDGYNEFSQFRKDYEQKFDKPVYVGPYMRWKWDRGAEVSLEQKEQSLKEVEVYRRWFHEAVMKPEAGGGSDSILVLPVGSGDPKYRDEPNGAPGAVSAFSANYIGSMQGLAQIVVPVGQTPYESRISKRTEYIPIVASMTSAPGSDLMLVALAKAILEGAGRPTKVETGRFMLKL